MSLAFPAVVQAGSTTPAIQSLLNSAAGQSPVLFPYGQTFEVTGLNVPSGSHLIIDGALKLAANTPVPVLSLGGVANVTIEGRGIIDGNRSAQSIKASGPPPWSACIRAQATTGLVVRGITLQEAVNWPMSLEQCIGARVRDVVAQNCGNSFQFANGSADCVASGLRISGISDIGFAFYGGVVNCSLTESFITSCPTGIIMLNDGGFGVPCAAVHIGGNRVGANGIGIATKTAIGQPGVQPGAHLFATIVGNVVYSSPGGGILLSNLADSIIAGNGGAANSPPLVVEPGCINVSVGANCL